MIGLEHVLTYHFKTRGPLGDTEGSPRGARQYTGLVERTDAFLAAAEADRPTDWPDQYMRFAMTFDTGAERYRWLNESLFLAEGHILGTNELEYRIYRVT